MTELVTLPPLPSHPEPHTYTWTCFHCNASFTDAAEAGIHFGRSERQSPACQIDEKAYREMEAINARHVDEDTDLHRQMYAMQSRHEAALRRDEEAGYAKGLRAAPEGYKLVPLCLTPEMRCELLNPHGLATTELYAMLLAAAPEPTK